MNHKLSSILFYFLLFTITAGAWVFTTPPHMDIDQNGIRFGNSSINSTAITVDNVSLNGVGNVLNQDVRTTSSPSFNVSTSNVFNVMNYFGAIVGTYTDSYSCSGLYCIYQPTYDSGKIYAKNMSTGIIESKGTDAYTVVQNIINVSNGNGSISVGCGIYNLSGNSITIYNNTDLTDSGFCTTWTGTGSSLFHTTKRSSDSINININLHLGILRLGSGTNGTTLGDASHRINPIIGNGRSKISTILIDGQGYNNQIAVNIQGVQQADMDFGFINGTDTGIYINPLINSADNRITVRITNANKGVYFENSSQSSEGQLLDLRIFTTQRGVVINQATDALFTDLQGVVDNAAVGGTDIEDYRGSNLIRLYFFRSTNSTLNSTDVTLDPRAGFIISDNIKPVGINMNLRDKNGAAALQISANQIGTTDRATISTGGFIFPVQKTSCTGTSEGQFCVNSSTHKLMYRNDTGWYNITIT